MEKKNYVKPNTVKVKIRQNSFICASEIVSFSDNAELNYVGSDELVSEENVVIRSRSFDAWDDED